MGLSLKDAVGIGSPDGKSPKGLTIMAIGMPSSLAS